MCLPNRISLDILLSWEIKGIRIEKNVIIVNYKNLWVILSKQNEVIKKILLYQNTLTAENNLQCDFGGWRRKCSFESVVMLATSL